MGAPVNAWPPEEDPRDPYRGGGPVDPPPEHPPAGPGPGGPIPSEPAYPPGVGGPREPARPAYERAQEGWEDEEEWAGRDDEQVRTPGSRGGRPPRGCMYLLVAFGAVLFFVAPFSVAAAFLLTMSGGPDDGARDWLDAVREGRYDAAVGLMCPRYRDTLSAADLRARIAEAGGISRSRISRTDTLSDTVATVAVDIGGVGGVADRHVTLSLAKNGDHWRVCSLP